MITFIIPSFNQAAYIGYTIESVVDQLGDGDQLLIMDGGSTDETGSVVAPYLNDSRIEWYSEPDKGYSDAINKAFSKVKNNIVGIMSSDDAYIDGIREKVAKFFNDKDLVLIYADYEIIDVDNNVVGYRSHYEASIDDILSLRVILPQSSTFFRYDLIRDKYQLDLEYDYIPDVILFNYLCLMGKYKYVNEVWSQVRRHKGSRTGKRNPGEQYVKAVDGPLAKMPEAYKPKARAGGMLLRARYEASSGKRMLAFFNVLKACFVDKRSISHWLLRRTFIYIALGPGLVERAKSANWVKSV